MSHTLRRRQTLASKPDGAINVVGSWKLGRTIGKGSSGRVKIARHVLTNQLAAVKIVSKHALLNSRMSLDKGAEELEKVQLSIEREIVIMKLIDHPNVLTLYDVWETSNELYLIMEYVEGGELFDYIVQRGRLDATEALHYFQQIIFALHYCHRLNIAHRDLKPENILIDHSKNIKVADFGMAAWETGINLLETSCGSPHYASPEVISGTKYQGAISDVWSCGVILHALLVGRLPFDDDDISMLLEKVKEAHFIMPEDIPSAAKDLLSRMLQKDVRARITVLEILEHPFFLSLDLHASKSISLPPAMEIFNQPILSVEDIDGDVFGNLRTLWKGKSDRRLLCALMSNESNWEKAVYYLLQSYRNRCLDRSEHLATDRDEDLTPTPSQTVQGDCRSNSTSITRIVRPSAPTPKRGTCRDDPASPSTDGISIGKHEQTLEFEPQASSSSTSFHSGQVDEGTTAGDIANRSSTVKDVSDQLSPRVDPPLAELSSSPTVTVHDAVKQVLVSHLAESLEIPEQTSSVGRDASECTGRVRHRATQPLALRPRNAAASHTPQPTISTHESEKENVPVAVKVATVKPKRKDSIKAKVLRRRSGQNAQAITPTALFGRKDDTSRRPSDATAAINMSWLTNVLNLKPATYTLESTLDLAATRTECRRILSDYRVSSVMSSSGTLRCQLDTQNSSGNSRPGGRPLHFKIELASFPLADAATGFRTKVTVTLEKGPQRSFRLVQEHFRSEWNRGVTEAVIASQ